MEQPAPTSLAATAGGFLSGLLVGACLLVLQPSLLRQHPPVQSPSVVLDVPRESYPPGLEPGPPIPGTRDRESVSVQGDGPAATVPAKEIMCGREWQEQYASLHRRMLETAAAAAAAAAATTTAGTGTRTDTIVLKSERGPVVDLGGQGGSGLATDPRFLVSVALPLGLADRMLGAVSAFYLALLTGRAFLASTHGAIPGFELAYDQPHVAWASAGPLAPDVLQFVQNKSDTAPKEAQRYASSDGRWYAYWLLHEKGVSDSVFGGDVTQEPQGHTGVPVVYMAKNWGSTYVLAQNERVRERLQTWNITADNAFHCAVDYLFRPTQQVQALAAPFMAEMGSKDTLKIGIQVRLGDWVFSKDGSRPNIFQKAKAFFRCAQKMERQFARPGQKVVWYVISDSLQLRRAVKARFGDKVVTDTEEASIHTSCSVYNGKGRGKQRACDEEVAGRGMQLAARDLMLFSMADIHLISKSSGFGKVGALMAKHPLNVYVVTPSASQKKCQRYDISRLAAVWSGV